MNRGFVWNRSANGLRAYGFDFGPFCNYYSFKW